MLKTKPEALFQVAVRS